VNSVTPTVATDPQSVKRGEKRDVSESDGGSPQAGSYGQRERRHEDPSLVTPGPRGLRGLPKMGKAGGWRRIYRPVFTPTKPGGKCRPTAPRDGQQERSNGGCALRGGRSPEQVSTACRPSQDPPRSKGLG